MANENILRANERLREERMRRGWSQQKLADELGIAVVTVNRWERGKQQPTGYYRLKLTTLFEKSAEELGLVESQTEVVLPVYAGEPQKNENEVVSAFRSERNDQVKDTIPLFYETVTEQSSLEREVAARPLSPRNYTYNLSSTSLLNKRRRTMLLLLVLIVLVVAAPITFLLIHFSKISVFPTSRSIRSSVVRITPSSLNKPFAPPITWKEVDDPLTKAHHDTQWTDDGSQCIFHADGYYSVSQGTNYCNYGDSSVNNISDLAYSVDVLFYKGNMGGLIFRLVDNHYYGFYITTTGKYCILWHTKDEGGTDKFLVAPQPSSAIVKGFKQKNTLSVLAQGQVLQFWINGQKVKTLNDTTYKSGTIGVFVGDPTDDSNATTEALFTNTKVWLP